MGNPIGKISVFKRDYNPSIRSTENSLLQYGYTRTPGTGWRIVPYREANGEFRTGLDPNAKYIREIGDEMARSNEKARVQAEHDRLTGLLNLDLGPRSDFYTKMFDTSYKGIVASSYKLADGDNIFDLADPLSAATYAWLRVHPTIAPSFQALRSGTLPASCKYYVSDYDVENEIVYKKKLEVNKAIVTLDDMNPEKRKKVARLLGLPATDNTKEMVVYNMLDSYVKDMEVKEGEYKGSSPISIFNTISRLPEDILEVRDTVEQAFKMSVLRNEKGRIYEGKLEVAKNKQELVERLLEIKHQEDLIALKEKLKAKKVIES